MDPVKTTAGAPEFSLTEQEGVRRKRRSRSKWCRLKKRIRSLLPWRVALLTIFVMFIVAVVSQSVLIADATTRLNSSYNSVNRILNTINSKTGTELTLNDFNRLEASLRDLSSSLARLEQRTSLLKPMATVNPDWVIMLETLDAAQSLTAATRSMLTGLQPALNFMMAGDDQGTVATGISSGERIVELLTLGRGQFIRAQDQLNETHRILENLDLSNISASLLLQLEDIQNYQEQVADVNTLLLEAPDLLTEALGLRDTQRYLILAQNSDELRPSGGFIGTYGWMTVRNGRITDYSYSPSTLTSPFPPPDDLASEINIPDWWIQYDRPITAAWDGSWHVDFPSTAEMAMWYYNNGNNPQAPVDAVIAIDIFGFEALLSALGRVRVPGYDVVVTPDNFRELVYDIRAFGAGENPHKRFVSEIYQQIFADWQEISSDQQRSADLLGVALEALQQRHIMIYFDNAELGDAMDLLGWSGRQEAARNHDYLLVADANLGNKSNRSIMRALTLDVSIQPDGTLQNRATVAYDYPARIADRDPAVDPLYHGRRDYGNLMQVFVPLNSTVVSTTNLQQRLRSVSSEEHTILVTRTELRYDDSARFQFEYETPPLIEQIGPYQRYRLLLQKQPGTTRDTFSLQISLPPGARLVNASPQPATTYTLDQLILDFRLDLKTDRWIEITFQD